jgi:uncharacterized protein YcfJ
MKYQKTIRSQISKVTALAFSVCLSIGFAGSAQAQEQARVVSSTPVVKQYNSPQQVCGTSQIAVAEPKSGSGALLGAVAGGLLGNTLGSGAGRAASTALGMVGGAVVGDNLEAPRVDAQNVTTCSTQNTVQSITVYQVVYEYAGKQYSVEMPSDPGKTIMIQLNPIAQGQVPPPGSAPPAGSAPAALVTSPTIASTLVAPAPTYIAAPYPYGYPYPYAYPYGYAPPVAIGFGFYGGWGGRHRR